MLNIYLIALFALSAQFNDQTPVWSVSENRTLIWKGQPYIPVGWRLPAVEEYLREVSGTGIDDVLIECNQSTNLPEVTKIAEELKLNYLISFENPAPRAPAFVIQPENYRIEKAGANGDFSLNIPNAISIYYLLVAPRTGSIDAKGWVPVINGTANVRYRLDVGGSDYTLLIFPKLDFSKLTDYWERFDLRRDETLKKIQSANFGEGLRGFVNPLGQVEMWNSYQGIYVPDSEMFRLEFQAYLEKRYGNDIDKLIRAWRFSLIEIDSFKTASRLIPLFSSERGLDKFFDPQTERMYSCDPRNSLYWTDLKTVIENAALRRTQRLAETIFRIANVPVIFEYETLSPIHNTAKPAGDGIGMVLRGTGLNAIDGPAASASAIMHAWKMKGWCVVTALQDETNRPIEALSLLSLALDTADLGARGWFIKWTNGSDIHALMQLKSQIQAQNTPIAQSIASAPRAVFYPENARNPAMTMRLPGGVWWLPTPAAGNRLEIGSRYEGYRHVAGYGTFLAIWRTEGSARVRLLLREPDKVVVTSANGLPVEKRVIRGAIELNMDSTPLFFTGTDEIPVPQDSIDLLQADFHTLANEAKRLEIDIGDNKFFFEDARKRIRDNAYTAWESMLNETKNVVRKLSKIIWIEGEQPSSSNFGYVTQNVACSGEKAYVIKTPFQTTDQSGLGASYRFRILEPGDYEIWLAARIPQNLRPFVNIELTGGTIYGVPDTPAAGYGSDFAWYRIGLSNLKEGNYDVRIRVSPNAKEVDVMIDAILLTRNRFNPKGPRMPYWLATQK